ncbi:MAG TPA: RNA-directed DNA polymerase, partial [Glaciihabitans sp.]|nr:RNA-directed DNA polymerase [Glaciihabitans sp.]
DGWARSVGATYTRYADDLTFSGTAELGGAAAAFIRGVTRIVEAEGHTVNEPKTRVRRANVRQSVTGIVVNATAAVPRDDYDRLKAILHNCERWGPHSQNREGHADFRAHLLGRIGWVSSLSPHRAQRLAESFARIRW